MLKKASGTRWPFFARSLEQAGFCYGWKVGALVCCTFQLPRGWRRGGGVRLPATHIRQARAAAGSPAAPALFLSTREKLRLTTRGEGRVGRLSAVRSRRFYSCRREGCFDMRHLIFMRSSGSKQTVADFKDDRARVEAMAHQMPTDPHAVPRASAVAQVDEDLERQFEGSPLFTSDRRDSSARSSASASTPSRRNLSRQMESSVRDDSSISAVTAAEIGSFSDFTGSEISSRTLEVDAGRGDFNRTLNLSGEMQNSGAFSHLVSSAWLDVIPGESNDSDSRQLLLCRILQHSNVDDNPRALVVCLGYELRPFWVPIDQLHPNPTRSFGATPRGRGRGGQLRVSMQNASMSESISSPLQASLLPPPPVSSIQRYRNAGRQEGVSDRLSSRSDPLGEIAREAPRVNFALAGDQDSTSPSVLNRIKEPQFLVLREGEWTACMGVGSPQTFTFDGMTRQFQAVRFTTFGPQELIPLDELRVVSSQAAEHAGANSGRNAAHYARHDFNRDAAQSDQDDFNERTARTAAAGVDACVALSTLREQCSDHLRTRQQQTHYLSALHKFVVSQGRSVFVLDASLSFQPGSFLHFQRPFDDEAMAVVRLNTGRTVTCSVFEVFHQHGTLPPTMDYADSLHSDMFAHLREYSQGMRFSSSISARMPSSSMWASSTGVDVSAEAGSREFDEASGSVSNRAQASLGSARVHVASEADSPREAGSRTFAAAGGFVSDRTSVDAACVTGNIPGSDDPDDAGFDDGAYSYRSARSTRTRESRLPKFDATKVRQYAGKNKYSPEEGEYHLQPGLWADRAQQLLHAQGVTADWWVYAALHCVTPNIQRAYITSMMHPRDGRGPWRLFDIIARPPRPESLEYSNFVTWLKHRFRSSTETVSQLKDKLRALKQGTMAILDFNEEFNRLLQCIHELQLVHGDGYAAQFDPDLLDPERKETREDRTTYLNALNPGIGSELRRWSVSESIRASLSNPALTVLPGGEASFDAARDILAHRVQHNGSREPRLDWLQQAAALLEDHLKDAPRLLGGSPAPAVTGAPSPWRARRAPSPPARQARRLPPPPMRLNALGAAEAPELQEVSAGDVEETELELLYQKLLREGRVLWTRAQLKKLMSEDRCFKCTQTGHRAPDCPNSTVNPRTFRFTNLVEIINFDEEEESLFNALQEVEALNEEASL